MGQPVVKDHLAVFDPSQYPPVVRHVVLWWVRLRGWISYKIGEWERSYDD